MSEAKIGVAGTSKALRSIDRSSRGLDEVVVLSDADDPNSLLRIDSDGGVHATVSFDASPISQFDATALVIANGDNFTSDFVHVSGFSGLQVTTKSTGVITGYVEWSLDGSTVNHSYSTPFAGAGDFHVPIGGAYARFRITNDSGSSVTVDLRVAGCYVSPSPFLFPTAGSIQGNFPALLVKSVDTAVQPDGDYVNAKADGTAFVSATALSTSQTYDSRTDNGYTDTDGWETIELVIKTDQVSASLGIQIHYLDDSQAETPVEIYRESFTFSASDVANGFTAIRRSTHGDGFYITYQNGGFEQGSFILQCNLLTQTSPPMNSLESDINGTSQAVMNRSAIFAENPSGDYGLIPRGAAGGLNINVKEHASNTPIKWDTSLDMSTATVGTGGSKIIDQTAIPAGATSVQIQASNSNGNASIYIATSQAGSVGGIGAGMDLASGQSVYLSIGEGLTVDVWAASSTGTARYRLIYTIGGGA